MMKAHTAAIASRATECVQHTPSGVVLVLISLIVLCLAPLVGTAFALLRDRREP